MINTSNTNSVQSFIRTVVTILSLLVLSVLLILPATAISTATFENPMILGIPVLLLSFWISGVIAKMFYILPEWEQMVLLRLGKFHAVRGAGFFIVPPFIYSVAAIVDMRIETQQVEATATLTKDNVPTKVTAAIEFKVENPRKAVIDVQNYRLSVSWLATEALKNTIGSLDLKELLSERDQIANSLKVQIDENAAVYGIDVRAVRLTDIDTPESLVEELAVIARAQRAAKAKLVQAEAEIEVARKLKDATKIMEESKNALRLRELQTLTEMSKEQGTMVIIYPYGDNDGKNIAHATTSALKK